MVKSLHEYIEKVEGIIGKWGYDFGNSTHPWYRGQGNENYELIPSLYRDKHAASFEREMTRDFQLNAMPFLDHKPDFHIEWMYIMQHYGIPTRLLDWTESYLFALYFAVEKFIDQSYNPCVWVFAPWSLNMNTINQQTIPTHSHDSIRKYELEQKNGIVTRTVPADFPVAIRPIRNNSRLFAQKGMFTIHGKNESSIDKIYNQLNPPRKKIQLEKIVIDRNFKKKIYRELYKAGITPIKFYPDLAGLSQDIKIRYSDEYMN
jgi:FRG domain